AGQHVAVVQVDAGIAGFQRLNAGDVVEVDDVAAVHAQEAGRVQPFLDRGDGRTQRVLAAAHPQVDVVAGRLQRLDVGRGDQEFAAELAHQEALRPVHRLHRRAGVRRGQQAGLALPAAQGEAVQLDHEHHADIAAEILDVLV